MKTTSWLIVSALLVVASLVLRVPILWLALLSLTAILCNLVLRWFLDWGAMEPVSDTEVWVSIGILGSFALLPLFLFMILLRSGASLVCGYAWLLAYFWTWQEPALEIGELDAKIAATAVMELASLQMWWAQLKLRIGMWIINL